MIACEYLSDGRCQRAEEAAARELNLDIVCSPTEAACLKCLASGGDKRPSVTCLQLVAPQIPVDRQPEWRRAFAKIRAGHTRKPKRPEPICCHRGEVLGNFPCQCHNGGARPLYKCDVFGQCVTKQDLSERAAEHLRKKHPSDRAARKFGVCQGCDSFVAISELT